MGKKGFTIIELVIVVAIVGILAAIGIPRMGSMMRKSHEAATKGNLGALRSALSVYYADTEGFFPLDDLTSLTVSAKYLTGIYPTFVEPWHRPGNKIGAGNVAAFNASSADDTNWWFFNDPNEGEWGRIIVNCIHSDARGIIWTSY